MEREKNSFKPLEEITCEIRLKLPSLNDYVNACRTNRFKASKLKKDIENEIGLFIGGLPRFENPVNIAFKWVESNKRRDYDNVSFAKKFILDALVKYGKLKDDNRRYVNGFSDSFEYGDETKVILTIREVKYESA